MLVYSSLLFGAVIVCQDNCGPAVVTKYASSARSPLLKTVVCRGPPSTVAVAGGTAASTPRLADVRAASAPMTGAAAELGRAATGDAVTLINRPLRVTLPWMPLPKTGMPATV